MTDMSRPGPTILVVDDTPENLRLLGDLLQSAYIVRAAPSGERALEVVRTPPRPDLILLDIMMPGMDGYDVLRRLRKDPETRDIPVIFLTALDGQADERLGLDLGAVDYITKPIRPAIVEARVRNHLEMKRVRDWLRDQNAVLEAEAHRFLEILAHHLQEPVRHQVIFSQMLQRALPKPISAEAETSLAQVVQGAVRLHDMMHDVQHYLSVPRPPQPGRAVPLEDAVDAACHRLAGKIAATGAIISRGSLPPVPLEKEQLDELLLELIGNALEYRSPERSPRIRVEAGTSHGEVIVRVTDNGCGIAPAFRERVFGVFERLHSDPGRPGTGIGLALAKKIVDAARGRIWLEDGDDGGISVHLALPIAKR